MPNTLVHFGVQGIATRAVWRGLDVRWILLAALLPDLPWIMNRIALSLPLGDALYAVHAYALAQSTLAVSLILAGALAALAARTLATFAVLAGNCLLHLLLDAAEIKWGNGVHLLAPWSWELLNYGVLWPESPVVLALGLVGLGFVAVALRSAPVPAARMFHATPARASVAAFLAVVWLALPAALSGGPYRADNHSIRTLHEGAERPGRRVELDRARRRELPEGDFVRTLANEWLRLTGPKIPPGSQVSIRGEFIDRRTVAVDDFQVHPRGRLRRDGPTYVGLALFAAVWLAPLARGTRRR